MLTPADTPPTAPDQMSASNWNIQAPYVAGEPQAIRFPGDNDAGGRDDVAGTVQAAQAAAEARFHEHESDTYGLGSHIGDLMTLPGSSLDPGVGSTGTTDPAGSYYDPPRNYGG